MRPDRLFEVRPQERNQRRTVEQMVDSSLVVPSLDIPVPQMVAQLADVLKQFDFQVPEQVIDVPKIYLEDFRTRTFRSSLLEPQMAEQLVEVPTIGPFLLCVRLWSRTWTFQFLVLTIKMV